MLSASVVIVIALTLDAYRNIFETAWCVRLVVVIQICQLLNNSASTRVWSADQQVSYLYLGSQWVGYDDVQSLTSKVG